MILLNLNNFINDFYFVLPEIYFLFTLCILIFFFSIIKNSFNFQVLYNFSMLTSLSLLYNSILYLFDLNELKFTIYLFNFFFKKNLLFNFAALIVILLTLFFILISILTSFVKALINYPFEYIIILLFCLYGILLLFIVNDLLLFYLVFELMSLSLYVLVAFNNYSHNAINSALKYYILGAISSSIMVLSIALIYGTTGLTNYSDIINLLYFIDYTSMYGKLIITIIFLFFSALLFKLGIFPFHFWLAEIYSGISYKTLFFIFLVPKFALIIVFFNFIFNVFYELMPYSINLLVILGLLSILSGTFCALAQKNIKRFLAFSSIVNVGYILIACSTFSGFSLIFIIAYLIVYFLNLSIFFIIMLLLNKTVGFKELKIIELNQLSNLFKTNPNLALILATSIFSIAGLPPFGGFYTKYFILLDLVNNKSYIIIIFILIISIFSTFYYIRMIKIIFFNKELHDKINNGFWLKNQYITFTYYKYNNINIIIYFIFSLITLLFMTNILITFYPNLLIYPLLCLLL